MLSPYALTSLEALKLYLSLSGEGNDPFLEVCIDRATALMEQATRRNLKSRSYSYDSRAAEYDRGNAVFRGNGLTSILLPQFPLTDVSALLIGTEEIPQAEYPDAGFDWETIGIISLTGYTFIVNVPVKVSYTAGYTAIPADLENACILQAAWMFKQSASGSNLLGVRGKTHADGTIQYTAFQLLPEVAQVLEAYRKRDFA